MFQVLILLCGFLQLNGQRYLTAHSVSCHLPKLIYNGEQYKLDGRREVDSC
jgi:hypothetical protein